MDCCCCLVAQLYPTVCSPMDCSLPGSSVHGILQARMLGWVAIFPSPGDLPHPGIKPRSPPLQADAVSSFYNLIYLGSLSIFESESICHSACVTLCDPMDCSPPGSSVYGILQASILDWVAIPFSRGSS